MHTYMLYIYIYSVNLTAYLNCSCAASLGSSAVPVIMLVDVTVNEDGAVYCKHCEMWLNGPTQWEDHKISKNHKKNVRQKDPHPRCWSSCNGVENAPYEPSMGDPSQRKDSWVVVLLLSPYKVHEWLRENFETQLQAGYGESCRNWKNAWGSARHAEWGFLGGMIEKW